MVFRPKLLLLLIVSPYLQSRDLPSTELAISNMHSSVTSSCSAVFFQNWRATVNWKFLFILTSQRLSFAHICVMKTNFNLRFHSILCLVFQSSFLYIDFLFLIVNVHCYSRRYTCLPLVCSWYLNILLTTRFFLCLNRYCGCGAKENEVICLNCVPKTFQNTVPFIFKLSCSVVVEVPLFTVTMKAYTMCILPPRSWYFWNHKRLNSNRWPIGSSSSCKK